MKNKLFLIATVLLISAGVRGQVTITGPACVAAGLGYQYLITTTDTSGTGISICLTGGTYTSSGTTCLNDSLVTSIYVTWDSAATGTISYTSPNGTATESVNITTYLQPGGVDSASLQQTIADSTSPAVITCPAATGGSCSPVYTYQWQQSVDNVSWANIMGAANQNMDAAVVLTQDTFFRRVVTEANSGSIGYSTTATVHINQTAQQ